jgi:phenylalanyl-tRNA synthetase beta subunit
LTIKRNLAFHIPEPIETATIIAALKHSAPDYLQAISITDLYQNEVHGQRLRAFTFELVFANNNQRSANDINSALEIMRMKILDEFAARGVAAR